MIQISNCNILMKHINHQLNFMHIFKKFKKFSSYRYRGWVFTLLLLTKIARSLKFESLIWNLENLAFIFSIKYRTTKHHKIKVGLQFGVKRNFIWYSITKYSDAICLRTKWKASDFYEIRLYLPVRSTLVWL
jgi:hypothetical protein